jgi:GMP synthase-like glutamine amidotransferase
LHPLTTPHALKPIHAIVRETELPVFGFCGGFQLIAQALGVNAVALSVPDDPSKDPPLVMAKDGQPFEFGYHPVELSVENSTHPLLSGLGRQPIFRHAHGLHVPELPGKFVNLRQPQRRRSRWLFITSGRWRVRSST